MLVPNGTLPPADCRPRNKCGDYGFSLLEMSVVLVIIATLIGTGIVMFAQSVERQQYDITRQRIAVIQQALLDYRRAFDEIPCPADASLPITNTNFGRGTVGFEGGVEDCTILVTPNMYDGVTLWGGGLPVRTLKLSDEFAFDGWGRRFMYYVDTQVAENYGFRATGVSSGAGDFVIIDKVGNTIANALYVLVSHGPNGHGAFTRAGTSRIASSVNTDELDNCNCDTNGADDASFNPRFVQKPFSVDDITDPMSAFDDIVVYGTRENMRLVTE